MLNIIKIQCVVNRFLYLIMLIFIANTAFAQTFQMAVKNNDGTYTRILTSDIEKITIVDCPATVTDANANAYNTVVIGNQCWMKENLNVGTMITSDSLADNQTDNSTIEKYCYNNNTAYCDTNGGLYQYNEAMMYGTNGNQGICPSGWHIPTTAELTLLGTAVSNNSNALKSVGQGTSDGEGTNASGFSVLLAGHRDIYNDGSFSALDSRAIFWSSTVYGGGCCPDRLELNGTDNSFYISDLVTTPGFSVRCLKD